MLLRLIRPLQSEARKRKVDNVTFNAFSLHLDSDFSLKLRIHLGTFIYFLLIFQLALAAMDILLDCHA